jgi:hypothetical protein
MASLALHQNPRKTKDLVYMAIKSDRWIRRMAQEHGMINPFNDRQVREGVRL